MWIRAIDYDEIECVITWKEEDATTLTCHSQSVPRGLYLRPEGEKGLGREGLTEGE